MAWLSTQRAGRHTVKGPILQCNDAEFKATNQVWDTVITNSMNWLNSIIHLHISPALILKYSLFFGREIEVIVCPSVDLCALFNSEAFGESKNNSMRQRLSYFTETVYYWKNIWACEGLKIWFRYMWICLCVDESEDWGGCNERGKSWQWHWKPKHQ